MKTKYKIIIVLIIIILFSYFIYSTQKPSQKWMGYENSRYDFSIDYPTDWQLGELEIGNAGRTFKDPKTDVECYAYGFANVLLSETGDPQTLNEFVDWLLDDPQNLRVIERKKTEMSGLPATYLLTEEGAIIKESVYVLGNESGIGFFCIYKDLIEKEKFKKTFNSMVVSMKIYADLDGIVLHTGVSDCLNLLGGAIEPLKDLQTFIDDEYTEVSITSREYWDKDRLPEMVLELEEKTYDCYPAPLEFDYSFREPAVTRVEWYCELKYEKWQYLSEENIAEKNDLEEQGYSCKIEECFGEDAEINKIWFCSK